MLFKILSFAPCPTAELSSFALPGKTRSPMQTMFNEASGIGSARKVWYPGDSFNFKNWRETKRRRDEETISESLKNIMLFQRSANELHSKFAVEGSESCTFARQRWIQMGFSASVRSTFENHNLLTGRYGSKDLDYSTPIMPGQSLSLRDLIRLLLPK